MLGRLVTLAAFDTAMRATLVKNHIEAAGIRCVLTDEFTTSNFWQLSNAIGGIKVQVAEEDLERAEAILEALEQRARSTDADDDEQVADQANTEAASQEDDDEANEVVPEPKPGDIDEEDEPPLNAREDNAERARKAVLIGLFFMPLQFYATWLLLDVWQSDLPIRPALRRKLAWTVGLHVPLLLFAILLLGFWLRGAPTDRSWFLRGY